jgi:DNA-directed RNA polymerase specialized sigma24 family protein
VGASGANFSDKEDLIQDCYLALLEEEVIAPADARAVCNRVVRTGLERLKAPDLSNIGQAQDVPAPDEIAGAMTLLDRLPSLERKVLQARYQEGMSVKETAEAMCLSEKEVKKLETGGLRLLREILGIRNA